MRSTFVTFTLSFFGASIALAHNHWSNFDVTLGKLEQWDPLHFHGYHNNLRRLSATARELQQDLRRITGVTVSDQTVRNRLREMSLRPRRPLRVPCSTQQHRVARFLFAFSHVKWHLRQWRPLFFTNESRFPLTQRNGRQREVISICQMFSRKATD